jgi:enamine deaminase RidA (YjgF/YER057c/UK114 family)
MERRNINPTAWLLGFNINQGIEVSNGQRTLYLSGQTSNDQDGTLMHKGYLFEQFKLAWSNLKDALSDADMDATNIVRLNFYTTDVPSLMESVEDIVAIYAKDGCQPVSNLLGVTTLFEPEAMIEIEATAVA